MGCLLYTSKTGYNRTCRRGLALKARFTHRAGYTVNKKTYRILALVLALAMGLGVAGIALADATFRPSSGTAYATDAVNVRSGPGTSYTVLGYLSRGEKVTITGTVSNGWTQLQLHGNRLGYVSSDYLSASYPSGGCVIVTPSGDRYKVNTGALNVRSGRGTNYRVIAVLEKGDIVTRIGQSLSLIHI